MDAQEFNRRIAESSAAMLRDLEPLVAELTLAFDLFGRAAADAGKAFTRMRESLPPEFLAQMERKERRRARYERRYRRIGERQKLHRFNHNRFDAVADIISITPPSTMSDGDALPGMKPTGPIVISGYFI